LKTIPLTHGFEAIVDDSDYELVMPYKWRCQKTVRQSRTLVYAVACVKESGVQQTQMQVVLMGKRDGLFVDHKNQNGLDNRRENLRWATRAQNAYNSGPRICNETGLKGVYRTPFGRYKAAIRINKKLIYLGTFSSPVEAAIAYNEAALIIEPEFAWVNPISQEN
jgi:hypothetical protein